MKLQHLWHALPHWFSMRQWSILQRLLLITLLPISYLFVLLVWHSYWQHKNEVSQQIEERGNIVTKLIAENSEYALSTHKLEALRFSSIIWCKRNVASHELKFWMPTEKHYSAARQAKIIRKNSHQISLRKNLNCPSKSI